jgi:lipopolysaccharide/colanic/teichoic acid biosynthesis glycosyltransferase
VHVEAPRYSSTGQLAKRAFDLVFAGLALVVLSPLLVVAALAVRVGGAGPVLERVERLGSAGERFLMWRFGTGRPGAPAPRPAVGEPGERPGRPRLLAEVDDPTFTRVGAFLDRYSIRELPQLLNVLSGDMSVVGPRPLAPEEVAHRSELAARRLLVKQGMTGTWQVSGGSELTWDEAVKLDLEYVENWSILRDLGIVWLTFRLLLVRTLQLRRVGRLQADLDASAAEHRGGDRDPDPADGARAAQRQQPARREDEVELLLDREAPDHLGPGQHVEVAGGVQLDPVEVEEHLAGHRVEVDRVPPGVDGGRDQDRHQQRGGARASRTGAGRTRRARTCRCGPARAA